MKEISVNDFGGEVKFTKYIADNETICARLLRSIGSTMSDYKVVPEEHTVGSKRVDLIVRDENDNTVQVIESQDANGWLDPVHASKIAWYCYDKGCNDGVLITEDCTEHMKKFIQWYNEYTPLNIFLLSPTIISDSNGDVDIFFTTILRPTDWAHKLIRPNTRQTGISQLSERDLQKAAVVREVYDQNRDIFSTCTATYCAQHNVNNTGISVNFGFQTGGYKITLRHSKHFGNAVFEESVRNLYEKSTFQQQYADPGIGVIEGLDEAIEFFNQVCNQINDGLIRVDDETDE